MGSVSTIKWSLPSPRTGQTIIQVDIDPTILGNNYPQHLSVAGDVRLVLMDLLALLKAGASPREPRPFVAGLNQARAAFWRENQAALASDALPLKPQRIIEALNRRLPSPAVVISDAGTPTPYTTRFLRLGGHGSRFLIPRAYGGLGYAIPAVVGAWLARPEARPVGLFGDGSLGMTAGELEPWPVSRCRRCSSTSTTPARLDQALQALHCGGKFLSVDFSSGDMGRVAAAFGIPGRHVETPAELDEGLDQAFAAQGPFFLDVVSEPEVNDLPPVYSWLKAAGREPVC